jgi:protein-disulfide isomerase
MTRNTRILLTTVVIVVAAVAAVLIVLTRSEGDASDQGGAAGGAAGLLVRDNSHRLNSVPDGDVTVVEFLDFECEACRAAYPTVEQLRDEYGDRVNFVIRYFPLPSHFNAERAARAVEAAAQQGKLEPMYQKMYETQAQWGEQREPADTVFRGFAQDLGLEMLAFDAAYHSPETLQRVRLDVEDGKALGVRGTPTFYVNGTQVPAGGLKAALDDALTK